MTSPVENAILQKKKNQANSSHFKWLLLNLKLQRLVQEYKKGKSQTFSSLLK